MIARGIGVAVSALSLTMDVKGRYGEALAELLGSWVHLAVSVFSTCSLLILGVLSATELILGIIKGAVGTSYWAIVIYVLVLLFWTYGAPHEMPIPAIIRNCHVMAQHAGLTNAEHSHGERNDCHIFPTQQPH